MKIMVHAHTTFSGDGELRPQQLADLARARGFDSVLVSDHFESLKQESFHKLVQECEGIGNCLMAPGYERSFRGFHVLALGVKQWCNAPGIQQWADDVRRAGGIVAIAHPSRYNHVIPEDILDACDAVEVWNSKFAYDGNLGPHPKAYTLLGSRRFPLCSQDLHGVRHASPVGIEIPAAQLNTASILACLRQGEYCMTNGLLSFDRDLSDPARGLLNAFHISRRKAVRVAIQTRRWIKRGKRND